MKLIARLLIFVIMISMPFHAQAVIVGYSRIIASGCNAQSTTPTFSETFDTGSGYDNTWTESGSPDPDNTDATPLSECGFATEMLKASSGSSSYSIHTRSSSTWGPEYVRFYFYVSAESLSDGESADIFWGDTNSNGPVVKVQQTAGQLQLNTSWNASSKATWSISTGTVYRLEIYTTDPDGLGGTGSGEVRLYLADSDSTSESWSGAINIGSMMDQVRLGLLAPSASVTIYYDYFGFQSSGWIGK
jgi:hypothetical protein